MMTGQLYSKTQTPTLTPRDDVKKTVSEILKRVDALIRKCDLDQAEQCIVQAREIDPKNIYAFAFEERVHLLKEQAHENTLATAAYKAAEESRRADQVQKNIAMGETGREAPTSNSTPLNAPETHTPVEAPSCYRASQQPVEVPRINASSITPEQHDRFLEKPEGSVQREVQCAGRADMKPDEERDLKVQRMIKEAVESVRREVEQQQAEIRSNDLEVLARSEQTRIKEATETARRVEEERQMELRKHLEEKLLRKIREEYRQKMKEDILLSRHSLIQKAGAPSANAGGAIPEIKQDDILVSSIRQETLSRYKLVLSSAWADGAVSIEEEATLKELRESLSVSVEEHIRLEKEVKYETYIEAFKKAWNSGTITPENASVLTDLRKRFQISPEEHLKIESKLLWEIQPLKRRPLLLVIDDDERLLHIVSKTLDDAGFVTTSVTTSDEAYAYLKETSPDLILCDVNLETSTIGGFAFYEKVRELERLRQTPFIFLSGLTDEALVRTGKELGVDDYLSKPISEETLIATIKGKLRRYNELKERMN